MTHDPKCGDANSANGLCAMCGADNPRWRSFGRAHSWTADHVELIEHLYCDDHEALGRFEAATCGRKFERRPGVPE